MYKVLYQNLESLKSGTDDETNGRHIVSFEAIKASGTIAHPRILDIGAGRGFDLAAIAE